MFVRIQKKRSAGGGTAYYASVVRNERVKGKTVQKTVAYIGRVDAEQIPYLKAAYLDEKPKLVWADGRDATATLGV